MLYNKEDIHVLQLKQRISVHEKYHLERQTWSQAASLNLQFLRPPFLPDDKSLRFGFTTHDACAIAREAEF